MAFSPSLVIPPRSPSVEPLPESGLAWGSLSLCHVVGNVGLQKWSQLEHQQITALGTHEEVGKGTVRAVVANSCEAGTVGQA